MSCGYDGASGTCDVCTGGIGNCVIPFNWSAPAMQPVHQTEADYWATKAPGNGRLKWFILAIIALGAITLMPYACRGASPQIIKVTVWQLTGNPQDAKECREVPNAQVSILHGDVDPSTATHGLWSAPADGDGKIIAGIRDGTYTVGVEVDGKYHRNVNGKIVLEVKGGENVLVKYIIARD